MVARTRSASWSAFPPGSRKTAIGTAGCVVQAGPQGVVLGRQLDPGDVAQPGELAFAAGPDHHRAELLLVEQPALGVDGELERDLLRERRPAQDAGGDLDVLLLHRLHHLRRGQVPGGDLGGIEPDPHGVVAGAEDADVAHVRQPRQHVPDLDQRVVPEIQHVVATVGRGQVDDHGQIGRALERGHAQPAHLLGQPGQRLVDPVLHLHLRHVHVGAEGEGHGQLHHAIGGRRGGHVEHVLDAVDLLLQRRRDRLGDGLGTGSGEVGADLDRRGHDLGVLADRERPAWTAGRRW